MAQVGCESGEGLNELVYWLAARCVGFAWLAEFDASLLSDFSSTWVTAAFGGDGRIGAVLPYA
jgi:hypothetical protein